MAEQNNTSFLIGGFIIIIVGVALIGIVADSTFASTHLSTVNHETIAISAGAGKTSNDDLTDVTFFGNITAGGKNTSVVGLEINKAVNWTRAGDISVSTSNFSTSATAYRIDYQYEADEYVTDAPSRTMISLTTLFFAIALISSGILIVKKGFEGLRF